MRADRYFKAAQNAFFRWDDNGSVLVWDNGLTIAFAPEIATVMRRVGGTCLPPFNTIAILLSACRSNWSEVRELLLSLTSAGPGAAVSPGSWEAVQLRKVVEKLDRIHAFPEHLRSSVDARAELMAMATANRHSTWIEAEATWLANTVEAGLPVDVASQGGISEMLENLPFRVGAKGSVERAMRELVRDALWLQGGLDEVDADRLDQQLRTGLTAPIRTAGEVEEEEELSPRDLIARLIKEDGDLGNIARLAQNLFAIVHFPRTLSEPDELPLGGVSDIANRGQLDKLVLTELANDDLTLAVRVAVNEAMYLRRESPPKARSQERFVLIDSGLCMWGVPRIYGIAAALAMVATVNHDTPLSVWRGDGEWIHEASLVDRDGLEESLHQLSSALHCAEALPKFVEQASQAEETQFVVISCADAIETPEFRSCLRTVRSLQPVHVLSVQRDGTLEFSLHSNRGVKRIRDARLDLGSIAGSEAKETVKRKTDETLPVIFYQSRFPVRVSFPVTERMILGCGDSKPGDLVGALTATSDGRLLLWKSPQLGATELSNQLGKGWIHWIGLTSERETMFVFGKLHTDSLKMVVVRDSLQVEITPISASSTPTYVAGYAGTVFVSDGATVESFVPGHSERVGTSWIPGSFRFGRLHSKDTACSARSRFLTDGKVWLAMAEEQGAVFEKIGEAREYGGFRDVFECEGYGPVLIGQDGSLRQSWDDQARMNVGASIAISPSGRRLASIQESRVVELVLPQNLQYRRDQSHDVLTAMEKPLRAFIREKQLRNKFSRVGVACGYLVLQSPKGEFLILDLDRGRFPVLTKEAPLARYGGAFVSEVLPQLLSFEPVDPPEGTAYSLSVAEFADGSQVFLDSRFMLHLKSANEQIPQVTLLLQEGSLSGWCEDGGFFGEKYFDLRGEGTPGAERAVEAIRKFAEPL